MRAWITLLFLIAVLLLIPQSIYAAEKPIQVYINGTKANSELQPQIINNTLYVPPVIIHEAMQSIVVFSSKGNIATIKDDQKTIVLEKGKSTGTVNGTQVELKAPFVHIEGRAFLPLQWISSQVGAKVTWDGMSKSAMVFKKSVSILEDSKTDDSTTGSDDSKDSEQVIEPEVPSDNSGTVGKVIPVIEGLPQIVSIELQGNQIIIQSTEQIQPSIFTLSDPNRLVIDFPNASFATSLNGAVPVQNGQIAVTNPIVDQIRYSMFTTHPANPRFVLDLKAPIQFEVQLNDKNRTIISLQPREGTMIPKEKHLIVIDPGHGGKDPGATGASGDFEKDFNFIIATNVFQILSKLPQLEVHMTRYDDSYPTLAERIAMANALQADLFVSIHANTNEMNHIRGTETYYSKADSKLLAEILHEKLIIAGGLTDRKVKKADFKVIKETIMPAALLEIGFISNAEEEAILKQKEFQDKIVAAIVDGLKQYLQIE